MVRHSSGQVASPPVESTHSWILVELQKGQFRTESKAIMTASGSSIEHAKEAAMQLYNHYQWSLKVQLYADKLRRFVHKEQLQYNNHHPGVRHRGGESVDSASGGGAPLPSQEGMKSSSNSSPIPPEGRGNDLTPSAAPLQLDDNSSLVSSLEGGGGGPEHQQHQGENAPAPATMTTTAAAGGGGGACQSMSWMSSADSSMLTGGTFFVTADDLSFEEYVLGITSTCVSGTWAEKLSLLFKLYAEVGEMYIGVHGLGRILAEHMDYSRADSTVSHRDKKGCVDKTSLYLWMKKQVLTYEHNQLSLEDTLALLSSHEFCKDALSINLIALARHTWLEDKLDIAAIHA